MSPSLFIWAAAIAVAFVAWPIVSGKSGVPGAWVAALVIIGSLIGTLLIGARDIIASPPLTWKSAAFLIVAGIINGIALYYYGMKAADPMIPVGVFVTTMVICMAISGPIISWLVNSESVSLQQIGGILFCVAGLYLLNRG